MRPKFQKRSTLKLVGRIIPRRSLAGHYNNPAQREYSDKIEYLSCATIVQNKLSLWYFLITGIIPSAMRDCSTYKFHYATLVKFESLNKNFRFVG
jgi:hypothetical protein